MKNGTTICSKHDDIYSLADKIRDFTRDIMSYAEAAKEDGQSMEDALDRYKRTIRELEERVEDLEKELAAKDTELADIQYRLDSFEV